jgi:hypothetical protein
MTLLQKAIYTIFCSPFMTSDDITIYLQLFSASLAYSATLTKFVCTATYKRTAQRHPNKPILKTATNHHAASRPTAAYFRSTMDWRYNTTKRTPKFADKTRQLSRDKKRGGGIRHVPQTSSTPNSAVATDRYKNNKILSYLMYVQQRSIIIMWTKTE